MAFSLLLHVLILTVPPRVLKIGEATKENASGTCLLGLILSVLWYYLNNIKIKKVFPP